MALVSEHSRNRVASLESTTTNVIHVIDSCDFHTHNSSAVESCLSSIGLPLSSSLLLQYLIEYE